MTFVLFPTDNRPTLTDFIRSASTDDLGHALAFLDDDIGEMGDSGARTLYIALRSAISYEVEQRPTKKRPCAVSTNVLICTRPHPFEPERRRDDLTSSGHAKV